MLRRIQALNYRCLRYVDVELDQFHVLVGPNGSGKSALFDAIAFVSDWISGGFDNAVDRRTNNYQDLVWGRPKDEMWFELALEFDSPDDMEPKDKKECDRVRYELLVREENDALGIHREALTVTSQQSLITTLNGTAPESIRLPFPRPNACAGDIEILRPSRSMLSPGLVERQFPYKYLSRILSGRVRKLFLESNCLRNASPPKARNGLIEPDGSNLPWTVKRLQIADPGRFDAWLRHVRTGVRDLQEIRVVEREDDRHAYLMLRYVNGVEVPSWAVSDGTLRLLALTLIAYLPDSDCLYLLEEPENGIHPLAVETVYQSLSSMWDSQVLVTSHSPELLMCAEPKNVLCFRTDHEGAAQIVPGHRHPRLAHWRSAADVDLLFASEILG